MIGTARALRGALRCLLVVCVLSIGAARAQVPAPALVTSTIDGSKLTLQGLRGKIVLVTFWATTCAICLAEQPDLVKTDTHVHAAHRGALSELGQEAGFGT